MATFLPNLAEHTTILSTLTTKAAGKGFPTWTDKHQKASKKAWSVTVVWPPSTSTRCLKTKYTSRPTQVIHAVEPFFPLAQLGNQHVLLPSTSFRGAELNYPMHEKELLAVICALKKWRSDLIGSHFFIFTDHKTLKNFKTQKDLSQRQARWIEFLSQYNSHSVYVHGKKNSVADALSRHPPNIHSSPAPRLKLWVINLF